MAEKIRIFIGLREIAGYFRSLKSGFDELGIKSVFVDLGGQPFKYGIKNNPRWANRLNSFSQKIALRFFRNIFTRLLWLIFFQTLISGFLFFFVVFRYNVFIFSSNSTFCFFLELPILRLFRKKIIYVFMGSESRPMYICGKVMKKEKVNLSMVAVMTHFQKLSVRIMERYADFVINIHPQALFQKKPFISSLVIGFPNDIKSDIVPSLPSEGSQKVRILHAPTDRVSKGSDIFLKIIDDLKSKGLDIDYVEITGKKNSEVLEELAKSDFVLDEMYSDTPLAGFSTEAAFCGRPAIIGSYYADSIKKDIEEKHIPPSMFVHPDAVIFAIERLINDEEFRRTLGLSAHKFVVNHWKPSEVAGKYIMLIKNDFPRDWIFHPQDLNYIYGAGVTEERIKQVVSGLILRKGIKSLFLKDKPHLEKKFLDLIKQEK
jgi:hypothetical protein